MPPAGITGTLRRVTDTAIVLAGGDIADPGLATLLPAAALVIAADGGLAQAAELGIDRVDVVIGDMDSVDPAALEAARAAGTAVETHPVDKDATDLELAIDAAVERGMRRVIVVGGGGGRLDHLLGNALLGTSARFAAVDLEWWVAGHRVVTVRRRAVLHGEPGDLVTLLPLGGPATCVTTRGLRWALDCETLEPGTTRGVSNELVAAAATVTVGAGTLLAIHRTAG